MPTQITSDEMTSNLTPHTARPTDGGWLVSWLPGRVLTWNEAITAMTLAEMVRESLGDEPNPSVRYWPHIEGWAAELGMDAVNAFALASLPPTWHVVYG
ncbi:MAG: hypothetical protein ACRDOI_18585 [Trebonia sp.]